MPEEVPKETIESLVNILRDRTFTITDEEVEILKKAGVIFLHKLIDKDFRHYFLIHSQIEINGSNYLLYKAKEKHPHIYQRV
jgi:hypothetical protein